MTIVTNEFLQPFTLPNGTELKKPFAHGADDHLHRLFRWDCHQRAGGVLSRSRRQHRHHYCRVAALLMTTAWPSRGAIGIDNDEKIAGLAKIAEAIKAQGSKAILQIYHGGRMVDPQLIGGASRWRQALLPRAA